MGPEQFAASIVDGSVMPLLGELVFDRGPVLSPEEVAERSGITVEQLQTLGIALGLARPWRDRDLRILELLRTFSGVGLPWEAIVEGARVYGDTMRRLADTEVRLVHVHVHERQLAAGVGADEVSRQIGELEQAVTPLIDPLIQYLHREHLLQAAIEDMFLHHLGESAPLPGASPLAAPRGAAPGRTPLGSVEATILFVDVAAFTALAESEGDEQAARVLDLVDDVVRALALEHDGKLVKQIGDGFMLAFHTPSEAVRFAIGLQDVLHRAGDLPSVRIGMNTGAVLHRAGDYLGSTVNVASRIAGAAMAGQVLLSDAVASGLRDAVTSGLDDGVRIEQVGVRLLRGIDEPLALWRVVRDETARDPVCGAEVGAPAARLRRDGQEIVFCSEECLRRFVGDADAAGRDPVPDPAGSSGGTA